MSKKTKKTETDMDIREYIRDNILILDGGMGTLLQAQGLAAGELPERWCIEHPDVIEGIHRSYLEAGSDVISTNTFGANELKYPSEEELERVIEAAVNCAREAQRSVLGRPTWVALDIGPTGKLLAPFGELEFERAVEIFAKTVKIGVRCGVDLIFIETMSDSYETKAALLAAKENSSLPVFVSCAYGSDGTLMTGAVPEAMVAMLEGMGADAVGVNCSMGPSELSETVRRYLACSSVPVILKPNAGLPRVEGSNTVYDITPKQFAEQVSVLVREGVSCVGGCCGTTPEYIRETAAECRKIKKLPIEKKDITVISSYCRAVNFGCEPVLIGERINPTGKKRFREALLSHDMDYILREGISQAQCGVQVLDVNVGTPGIDERELLCEAVRELASVCELPLQIDTSDFGAMEAALRIYNGKPLINSVNGKEESMAAVFPLAKKYGGVIIALTLDENGIPETAEGRLEIAERILERAQMYEIDKKDIIFDPLALTVSADDRAASETLRAVELITKKLGAKTSLGVSNVSFGLPMRDWVNASFFALALGQGLSAAIINPYSQEMMRTYYAYLALSGADAGCRRYIGYAQTHADTPVSENKGTKEPNSDACVKADSLYLAVIHGMRERAAALAREGLLDTPPLELIEREIIPALNTVGVGFEQKTVYLPSLLMSAEAAGAAFEVIGESVPADRSAKKYPILLATVRGDIHDIGKNIVKLLLESYGYDVHDLGRDVPAEKIADEAVRLHVPLVGLSALMTTTLPAMEKAVKELRERAPWCKVMVGGAVLTEEYAAAIGADKYAPDAMEGVRYAESLDAHHSCT